MPSIDTLIESLPEIAQSRLVASGYGLWVAWKGKLNAAVEKTLQEYGVLKLVEERDQALWFCNTTEIFRALARLQLWARVNPIPAFFEVLPLTFLAGYQMEYSASVAPDLHGQSIQPTADFDIIIHPKLKKNLHSVQGLTSHEVGKLSGLKGTKWLGLNADQGLDYETDRKWYFIIKPLGQLSDKEAIFGWRDFSKAIFALLQKQGLKYISDVDHGFILFPLDSFALLRAFCNDMMQLIRRVKEDEEGTYWPVVMAAIHQGNLSFSSELPKKCGLDWDKLSPDFPHMRYMDGFLLSPWFSMMDVRYGTDAVSLDSWCSITLMEGGALVSAASMQVALPSVLVKAGDDECFYCGQKNHVTHECPSKKLAEPDATVWQELADIDVDTLSRGFAGLEKAVPESDYVNSMLSVLQSKKSMENVLARAVFEINVACQFRMLELVWRSRDKEWSDGFSHLAAKENNLSWKALVELEDGNLERAEVLIKDAQMKFPRSYQPQSLWGFWYLETGDFNQAQFHWEEAERMSYTPLQQGYFAFLRARLFEVDGNLKEAINVYKQANTYSSTWVDPVYRQGVCMVKMGFTGQAMDLFADLIARDPNIFNKMLIDPELDRGRVQLMSALGERWAETEKEVSEVRIRVQTLTDDIAQRFDESHSYYDQAYQDLEYLKELGKISNYVAYRQLMRGTEKFISRLDTEVKREIKRIDNNIDYLTARVKNIQKEAAWFPFPKLLRDFNKDFNYCVDKINWIKTQRINDAEKFRKAFIFTEEIEERIDTLQGRLVTLRIIRDSTLFILMLGRNFIWLELLGLGLALVGIPALVYFTKDIQGNWILDAIHEQRWEFTKGFVIILSFCCLALAAVKSAFSFEKRKQELFEQLDEDLRASAPKRY